MYMQRHQIYLDSPTVSTFDDISKGLGVTRSKVIRDVLARVGKEYARVLRIPKKISLKNHPLMKMAGMIKSPTGDVASGVDDIYFQD